MCRIATAIAGLLTIALLLLAFTRLPGRAYAWFAEDEYKLTKEPDAIVVLGAEVFPANPVSCGATLRRKRVNAISRLVSCYLYLQTSTPPPEKAMWKK